jgi:TrmH family RNA methyltransferase
VITLGAHSPKLDAVRELRTKKGRRERKQFVVEGSTMLEEALAAGLVPVALYVIEQSIEALPASAAGLGETFLVPERAMAKLSLLETPPGILAVFAQPSSDLEELLGRGEALLLLAGVGDPGNAGTLLRTAEIFGMRGAIFTTDAVEPFNPKVARATMGAIFRMKLALADPGEVADAARRHGFTIVAAERGGTPLPGFVFPKRSLIAIGHERHGLAKSLPGYDVAVGIPQRGEGESLNASIAGGIILYAFAQQGKGTNVKL